MSHAASDPIVGLRSLSDVQGVVPASPFLERAAVEADAADAPFSAHASGAADASYLDGTFTDVSFFVLTGQVAAGDVVAADHLPEFMRQLGMCSSQDCICEVALSSGQRKTLHFSYTVGQYIPNAFFDTPIARIFPADIGDRAQHPQAPTLPRFCAHDNVLVVFGPLQPRTKFLVFPGSSVSLQLCRLTPALCQSDLTAACCWSELQDQFAVVMGLEFDMYEITALTLMRNDSRADCFSANLQELEQRARSLPASPHWLKTARDVAAALSAELETCREGLERAGIDGMRLGGMGDAELAAVAASVGGRLHKDKLFDQLKGVRAVCEDQIATMRHFEE